jgi:galactokinase
MSGVEGPAPRARALAAFRNAYGVDPAVLVRAPGRVNLIGEHTDYNDGFVLPFAIGFETLVAAGPAAGEEFTVIACDFTDAQDRFSIHDTPHAAAGWARYVRGAVRAFADLCAPAPPLRMAIAGNVPLGSGLSSSAALTVAICAALAESTGAAIAPEQLARTAQYAENHYAGIACGIMDQLASVKGQSGHALLIDCRALVCTPVAIADAFVAIVAHSGVRHSHAGGAYNDRRNQCLAAANICGVPALRDVDLAGLLAHHSAMDDIVFRRARHVVTENARTLEAAAALQRNDIRAVGVLMADSHRSMRDDFEITVPEVDQLVAIMQEAIGAEGGARMTGGGFGGCAIALTHRSRAEAVHRAVAEHYRTPEGNVALVMACHPQPGVSRLDHDDMKLSHSAGAILGSGQERG